MSAGREGGKPGAALRTGLRAVIGPDSPVRRNLPEPVRDGLRDVRRRMPTRVARVIDRAAGKEVPPAVSRALFEAGSKRPVPPAEPTRLWIAPANFAGQGRLWARSVDRNIEGVGARCMAVTGAMRFAVDQEVDPSVYRDAKWQYEQEKYVLANYSHVLVEAERPVFGTLYGRTCAPELPRLRAAGLQVGLISHGSDVRIPSEHAARFPHSPFDDPDDRTTKILQKRAEINARLLREFDGPVFVSTPDLLDYVPGATWCPAVVNPTYWVSDWPLLQRRRPRVVHIPSNGRLKGTEFIDPVLTALADEGRIEYRTLRGLDHDAVRLEYQEADIVVDQVVLGLYGVASIEAMAAGRVTMAFLGDAVRDRIRSAAGLDCPIVEVTPETLREQIERVLDDRDAAAAHAALGPEYVRAVHDGHFSAQALQALVGGELRPAEEVPGWSTPSNLPMRPSPARDADVRLWVGPANFAGQGTAWARAAERHLPGVSARAMAPDNPVLAFETDYTVDRKHFEAEAWPLRQERYLTQLYTHVLIEAMRPVTGYRHGLKPTGEIPQLRAAGVSVAMIAHGTDVRIPSVHRTLTPYSAFRDEYWTGVPSIEVMEERAQLNVELMRNFDGPRFASTPDLLAFVPEATWCPVVVDLDRWRADTVPGAGERIVVAHAPSHGPLKGSAPLDATVRELEREGVLEYRRIENLNPAAMPGVYRDSDVVLDQFVIGSYGVAAVEAMAAGRVVVGHVTDDVRAHVKETTGLDLPVVEATLDTVADVLRGLVADPARLRELGEAGVAFAREVHDGRRSAQVLGTWLVGDGDHEDSGGGSDDGSETADAARPEG
ncbi:glycosyltransferase [Agilicoccus flavus]|uniref:glycosyltransferase n=1 Tax=Agilicoccus flavus TaxID=2775968 RepID=UPI001CF64D1D|nr:hypothetical protein [Agilicoccus flavus]